MTVGWSGSRRLVGGVALALAACLLTACEAEAPAGEGEPEPAEAGAPAIEETPAPPPGGLVPGTLAGTWWALSTELPHKGLRMTFEAPPGEGSPPADLSGSWISFDWRSSDSARDLTRESRAVAIGARRAGDEWIVQGPAPQIDASGQPNGDRGAWELRVRRISLPGEELPRYSGRMLHTDLTPPEGVTVELTPRFRPHDR